MERYTRHRTSGCASIQFLSGLLEARRAGESVVCSRIEVRVVAIDLDIDSDNNDGFGVPSRSSIEDDIEDTTGDPEQPGKVILASTLDRDNDGIPDFADGWNARSVLLQDDELTSGNFVPLVLEVLGVSDPQMKVRILYDASSPSAMATTMDAPYVLPPGKLRLWSADAQALRSEAAIQDGGNYVAPADYAITDFGPGLAIASGGPSWIFYAEAVDASESIASIDITASIVTPDRTVTDVVRVTASKVELQRLNQGESIFSSAGGIVASRLPDPAAPPPEGMFVGPWQIYQLLIWDPRPSGSFSLRMNQQEIPISRAGSNYQSSAFIALPATLPPGVVPPSMPSIVLTGNTVECEYNPFWWFSGEPTLKDAAPDVQAIGKAVAESIDELEDEAWVPVNPNDNGAFGKAVHAKVAPKLSQQAGWQVNVHVNTTTKVITKIDGGGTGATVGQIELDAIKIKDGAAPFAVGEVFDPERVENLHEVKTSVQGKIDPDIKSKMLDLMEDDKKIQVMIAHRRWTPSGWAENPRYVKKLRILAILGASAIGAKCVYAMVSDSGKDERLYDIELAMHQMENAESSLGRLVDAMPVVEMIAAYLGSFTPDDDGVNFVKVGMIYAMIDEFEW